MAEETAKRKPGRPKGSTAKPKPAGDTTIKNRPKTAKGRLDAYIASLPKATMNDIALLENMVAMEIEMERLRGIMPTAKDGLEARKISEAISNHSKEYRLILDSLGIGRNKRSNEIDMQNEVDALVAEATALVEKSGIKITCTHCKSDYEMGWVLFHFRDDVPWLWAFVCPKCECINRMDGSVPFPKTEKSESGDEPKPGEAIIIAGSLAAPDGSAQPDQADRDRDPVQESGPVPEPSL